MKTATIKRDDWEVTVDIDHVNVVNYALYHCNIPIIRRIVIRNTGPYGTPKLRLEVSIEGYSAPWIKDIPAIQSGGKFTLEPVELRLDYTKLEGRETRTRADLNLTVNGDSIYNEAIDILGFYEWPTEDHAALQKSIACFVQPAHPAIQRIVLNANNYLNQGFDCNSFKTLLGSKSSNRVESALQAMYESIQSNYRITYDSAPVYSYEKCSQAIRPPHRVVDDLSLSINERGNGIGTCIDLALLFAACLEYISLKPMVVFVRKSSNILHAFAGCRQNKPGRSLELFVEHADLTRAIKENQLILIETTGLTETKKLDFEKAIKHGKSHLKKQGDFLFALDIAAARENRLFPLQFAMSPGVIRIMRKAESLVLEGRGLYLESKHLLFGLFLSDIENNPLLVKALQKARIDLNRCREVIHTMTEHFPVSRKRRQTGLLNETMDYRRIIEEAKVMARGAGQGLIDRTHLIAAIFRSRNDDVKRILRNTGIEQDKAISVFEKIFPWFEKFRKSYYPVAAKGDEPENERLALLKALRLEALTLGLDLPDTAGGIDPSPKPAHSTNRNEAHNQRASVRKPNLIGINFLATRDYEKAIAHFERAVAQEPENSIANNGKGYCLIGRGLLDDAGALFDKVLAQNPIDPFALVGKGIILTKSECSKPAAEYLGRALAVHPRIPSLWYHRAKLYTASGISEKALDCFYQALELLVSQKRGDEASAVVNEGLKTFPSDIRLRQFQAWIMRLVGSEEEDLLKSKEKQEALYRDMKESDPEIEGPLAGTYKRLWSYDPIKYNDCLQKSFDLYHHAWIASKKKNLYVGINAATVALLIGRPKLSREIASEILTYYHPEDLTNLPHVGPKFSVYWYRATQAEAELLLGHLGKARRIYSDIMELHREKTAYIDSSLAQIDLILPRLGLSIDSIEFLGKSKASPGGRRLRFGVIGCAENPSPQEFQAKVRQILNVIGALLPDNVTWQILTDLEHNTERRAANVVISEKHGFLRIVSAAEKEREHGMREDKEEIQGLLNEAEEIVFLPADKESGGKTSDTHQYILNHSDAILAITETTGEAGSIIFEKTLNHARKRNMPLICIDANRGCKTTYENLEEIDKSDYLKGDYLMYDPKPIDTTHIELSEDMLDLTELLAQNAHDIWAIQRMDEGWTYGPERNDPNKKHPDLIPYVELPASEKEYDRKMTMETLKAITALGYRIEKV